MTTMVETAGITQREREQVERANATAATPVAFIHGLWLLPSSWDPLGGAVRGGWVRRADAGLAGRSGDGGGGPS